jgi:hypothetical protein
MLTSAILHISLLHVRDYARIRRKINKKNLNRKAKSVNLIVFLECNSTSQVFLVFLSDHTNQKHKKKGVESDSLFKLKKF